MMNANSSIPASARKNARYNETHMTSVQSFPRPARFEIKDDPPGYRLDDRKVRLLRALARHRFLTSVQLAEIDGGSHQKVLRILRTLYDHEFVHRPPSQRFQMAARDNRPLVYGLAHAGARVLADLDGTSVRNYNWTTKSNRRTAETIIHTIDVAAVMRAVANSVSSRGLQLLDHDQLIPKFPEETRRPKKGASPFNLRVEIPQDRAEPRPLSVIPDRLFSVVLPGERISAALELDRSTMPVRRWRDRKKQVLSLDGTSIARKFIAYHEAWNQDLYAPRWGFRNLRVLFVTPSRARIEEMLDALEFVTKGKGARMFVFTDQATLLAGDPLGAIWTNGKRETTSLLD